MSEVSSKKSMYYVAAISVALAVIIGGAGLVINGKYSRLKEELRTEKLKQDSILSTKILLDKEIAGLSKDIENLKSSNKHISDLLAEANAKLNNKIIELNKINKENLTVKRLKKELNDIRELRDNLNKQIDELLAENLLLKSQVTGLKDELAARPVIIKEAEQSVTASNFMIEPLKSNDKLTVKTRRVKSFQLSFELSGLPASAGEQEFYVSIADPAGNEIIKDNIVDVDGKSTQYSLKFMAKADANNNIITPKLRLNNKLKLKGVYSVRIYNTRYGLLGKAQVRTM